MCNCAGVQVYSNCAGNPDCNCDQASFNNMVGINGFSNTTGVIAPIAPIDLTGGIKMTTTIPTINIPAPSTTPTKTPTTSTAGQTLNKVLDLGSSVLGMFSKPSASSAPVVIPTEEKKIPTAVWVVIGGLLLLVVAFVIVKAAKK